MMSLAGDQLGEASEKPGVFVMSRLFDPSAFITKSSLLPPAGDPTTTNRRPSGDHGDQDRGWAAVRPKSRVSLRLPDPSALTTNTSSPPNPSRGCAVNNSLRPSGDHRGLAPSRVSRLVPPPSGGTIQMPPSHPANA